MALIRKVLASINHLGKIEALSEKLSALGVSVRSEMVQCTEEKTPCTTLKSATILIAPPQKDIPH